MSAPLILASQSPRRRELLALAGFAFEVVPADIDETRMPGEAPATYVERLAREKARVVHARFPDAVVLAADTTVELDGEALEKPVDREDARRMLRALAGRAHEVHTGIAVRDGAAERWHVETTRVVFGEIAEDELELYVASDHALDKAGAYGIQGYAARWIPRIEGDYFNVMGLPVAATVKLLRG